MIFLRFANASDEMTDFGQFVLNRAGIIIPSGISHQLTDSVNLCEEEGRSVNE